ncbi:hypothetical protein BC936DRAFT_139283 [Jimgerdemannia flammicorona]|uniref:Uncharacterized protein n=2 Tax=Jimgerdemannia flammicorona TaxID=994334 RepID=A0A433QQ63_9FUNG|nr:hypothetical protein BC936DRAFT_139283 [Jimgerdemannia flammicorona]RUS31887.1 hypothetical protein BC938DRAFT_476816 [Jimgerdemannia flammicorona]
MLTRNTILKPAVLRATALRWSSKKPKVGTDALLSVLNQSMSPTSSSDTVDSNFNEALGMIDGAVKKSANYNPSSSLTPLRPGTRTVAERLKIDISSSLNKSSMASHNLHIHASYNNTILTLAAPDGSNLVWTSGGTAGFKKAARGGYEAAHQAAIQMLQKVEEKNLQVGTVHLIMKGFGPGRDAAFKAIVAGNLWGINRITDATPIPFNGCRPKKTRRL